MHQDMVQPHLKELMESFFEMIAEGIPIEKEAAVLAMSSTVEAAKGYFETYV